MEVSTYVDVIRNLSYEKLLKLVKLADRFESYIIVETDTMKINLKSILSLSMLSHCKGKMMIRANGQDAKEAIKALEFFFKDTFIKDNLHDLHFS
jgi:phosphotransferase system HPr (HPr) family protein